MAQHTLDSPPLHVCHRPRKMQRAIDAAVAVRRLRYLGSVLQHDLAVCIGSIKWLIQK
jgi:hypothetical protein